MLFQAANLDIVSEEKTTIEKARNDQGQLGLIFQQFGSCLDHLADWNKVTHVSYTAWPFPEMNIYKGLHSRLRPYPFATTGYLAAVESELATINRNYYNFRRFCQIIALFLRFIKSVLHSIGMNYPR